MKPVHGKNTWSTFVNVTAGPAVRLRAMTARDRGTLRGVRVQLFTIMATTTKRNRGSDRGRISSQRHEVSYAGKKLGRSGAARVRKAKKSLGRKTSRKAVMQRARSARR